MYFWVFRVVSAQLSVFMEDLGPSLAKQLHVFESHGFSVRCSTEGPHVTMIGFKFLDLPLSKHVGSALGTLAVVSTCHGRIQPS